jgi:cell division septal protein FtsQ
MKVEGDPKMPSEISVRIVERKPIAWITSDKDMAGSVRGGRRFSDRRARHV